MPIRHSIWTVGASPAALAEATLPSEALLEDMIVAEPAILSDQWMLVGRQEPTSDGGRIDLLALAPDGALILIELKRGRTPREVVAQAIDYATWAERLDAEALGRIYARFKPGGDLLHDFQQRFGPTQDEVAFNASHQVVIVAAGLDAASERIVGYLAKRGIAINVLGFQVHDTGTGQLLSRAWLIDPAETQAAATVRDVEKQPWNGEFYVSYGHSDRRSWEEARQYAFISGGGGTWYSGTLRLLKPGDRVWVKAPGYGFVGVGLVRGEAAPMNEFTLPGPVGEAVPATEVLKSGNYHREFPDDPEHCEWFVPMEWLATVPLTDAVHEPGLFGNQNTVCAPKTPKWRHTVDRLKQAFGVA